MPKLTAAERAALEAKLAEDDTADDDDAAFTGSWWEEDPKTGRKRGGEVTGRTGLSIMRKWAPDLFDPPVADDDDQGTQPKRGASAKPKTGAPPRKTVFSRPT